MIPTLAPLSVEWFGALQRRMNASPEKYRRIGASDFRMIVRITDSHSPRSAIGLVFEDYACTRVCADPSPEIFDPDFVIEGPYDTWAEMAANIREHGRADARQTLNTLTLMDEPLRVTGSDQTRVDQFARHNYTLQEFFNEAGHLEESAASATARSGAT